MLRNIIKSRKKVLCRFYNIFLSVMISGCIVLGCKRGSEENKQSVLARVNGTTVSADEFIKRFELTPRTRQFPSLNEAKKSALLSLAGEKVLAQEGYKRGFDKDPMVERLLLEIEREAVVEEVYRTRVRNQVEVSDAEMKEAYNSSRHVMRVQYFAVQDSIKARQIENMLNQGMSFSRVAQSFVPDLLNESGKLPIRTIEWGKSDERLERSALELKPGEVSAPINIGDKTFFMFMEEHLIKAFKSMDDYQQQSPRLKKVLTNRKESHHFARYMNQLMADSQVRVESKIYGWLVKELELRLNIESQGTGLPATTILREGVEWSRVTSDLDEKLQTTFLIFKNGSWTVGEFLERLWFGSYPLNTKSKSDFRAGLYQTIKRMIEDEFMAREGFKQGFHRRPSVRQEVRIWKESLVAAHIRKALMDTIAITDPQIKAHFEAKREKFAQPEMIKVQEILVNDEALAQRLLQEIRDGANMADLARRHTKRKQGRENGGILELFGRNAHGKLGEVAFQTPGGELVGPVQIGPHAFSVFRVLERQPGTAPVFEEMKEAVKLDLFKIRSQRAVTDFVVSRMKSTLQMEWQALDTVQVSSLNLLTLKLGFPGRLAVPIIHDLGGLEEQLIPARNNR